MAQAHWYTIYSKPQKEAFAQANLQAKGLQVFFPKLKLPVGQKRRKSIVPLFPNYLFARFDASSEVLNEVVWAPGVKRVIGCNGVPLALEDQVVDFLVGRADQSGCIRARSNLSIGQQVRITDGPLRGLMGVIDKPPDARGRVGILMSLLNRGLHVKVPVHFVECEWLM